MTIEQIKKARDSRPFKPFALKTAGGREYFVPHPEFLMVTPPGRKVIIADEEGAVEVVELLLVESLLFPNGRFGP